MRRGRQPSCAWNPRGPASRSGDWGTLFGAFELPLLGQHNVRNALAAVAVGATLGLDARAMANGLRGFEGVKRRLELRGSVDDIRVYDDFAHHPTAVSETLAALKLAHPDKRVWAIFEPRSASSCLKVFQDEFAQAFDAADEVVVAPVFKTTIAEDRRLSPADLVKAIKDRKRSARAAPSTAAIVDEVSREAAPGDLIVIMSNGGFDGIHDRLLDALRARPR